MCIGTLGWAVRIVSQWSLGMDWSVSPKCSSTGLFGGSLANSASAAAVADDRGDAADARARQTGPRAAHAISADGHLHAPLLASGGVDRRVHVPSVPHALVP